MIETVVTKQQTNIAMDSEVCSMNQSKTVNFDHSREFQECMDTYEISNRVESFETIALAIAFYESSYNVHLTVTERVLQIIINNIHANNIQDVIFHVSFSQHHHSGLLHQKKIYFWTEWFYYGSGC